MLHILHILYISHRHTQCVYMYTYTYTYIYVCIYMSMWHSIACRMPPFPLRDAPFEVWNEFRERKFYILRFQTLRPSPCRLTYTYVYVRIHSPAVAFMCKLQQSWSWNDNTFKILSSCVGNAMSVVHCLVQLHAWIFWKLSSEALFFLGKTNFPLYHRSLEKIRRTYMPRVFADFEWVPVQFLSKFSLSRRRTWEPF